MRIGAQLLATGIFAIAIVMVAGRGIANEKSTNDGPWLMARTVSLGKIQPGQLDHRWKGSLQFDCGLRASPGLTRLAQLVMRHGKAILVIDGVESRPYDDPYQLPYYEPVFSADDRHLAFTAVKNGRAIIVEDGIERESYPYTRDGDGIQSVVLMGQGWGGEPIAFTADSRHLIHLLAYYFFVYPQVYAVDESIVPGSPRKSRRNDDIHQIDISSGSGASTFSLCPNRFSFLAVRHSEVLRVDVEIANGTPRPFRRGKAGMGVRPESS